jgi:ABC-2 type transport system ATP-binding protein
MEEADKLCERLAVMDHGNLLALDTPSALKRTVGGDTIVRMKADGDPERLAVHMQALDEITDARVVDGVVHLTARGAEGLLPKAIDHAEEAGHTVRDVSVEEPTLETVFINLTGKDLRE